MTRPTLLEIFRTVVARGFLLGSLNGASIADVAALLKQSPSLVAGRSIPLVISRHQKETTLTLLP